MFRWPKKDSVESHELIHDGQRIPVQVRFDRFSTLRLSVRRDGTVSLRAPFGTSAEHLRARLESKAPWIARHLERFRALGQAASPCAFTSGEIHPYLGTGYRLEVVQGRRSAVRLDGDALEVVTLAQARPDTVRRLLDAWYAQQAREVFTRVIRELVPRLDAHGAPRPAQLKIRAMTSRWGTCSRAGVITLNRHLVKAPLPCVEFVAAHELCHLKHLAHNAPFYGLLAAIMPDWRERKKRLSGEAIL